MKSEDLCLIKIDDWCDEEFSEFIKYMRKEYKKRFHYSNIDDQW